MSRRLRILIWQSHVILRRQLRKQVKLLEDKADAVIPDLRHMSIRSLRDILSGQQVMELFRQLNDEGMTIVMITHDADIAKQAKKTYHIFDGEIRENQKEGGAADE